MSKVVPYLRPKSLLVLMSLIAILGMPVLASSCYQLAPGSNPTASPGKDLSYLRNSNPAHVDNTNLPITPVDGLHRTGSAREVDIATYSLTVDGLVDTALSLSYEAVMQYPSVTEVLLLICPGFFVDNAEWTGVPVATLLAEAGIKLEASQVAFRALDGYRRTLSWEDVQSKGVFLAHTVNGQILPREHGYPLRLVVRGEYGDQWVKWVDRIEVT